MGEDPGPVGSSLWVRSRMPVAACRECGSCRPDSSPADETAARQGHSDPSVHRYRRHQNRSRCHLDASRLAGAHGTDYSCQTFLSQSQMVLATNCRYRRCFALCARPAPVARYRRNVLEEPDRVLAVAVR